jgi:hypothetical protein
MDHEAIFQIMAQRQKQIDDLNLVGRSCSEALYRLRDVFPGFRFEIVTNSLEIIIEDARPKRIWIWVTFDDTVKAIVHG